MGNLSTLPLPSNHGVEANPPTDRHDGACARARLPTQATLLEVKPSGLVPGPSAKTYMGRRHAEVAKRLQVVLTCGRVRRWFQDFTEEDLFDSGGKYLGDESGRSKSLAALRKAKETPFLKQRVAAVEEFILHFCGFQKIKAKYLVNALHFMFSVDTGKLLSTQFLPPSDATEPGAVEKAVFDESEIASAELLLRVVVEADDGTLVANPCSPGLAMSFLHKLPLFAQLVMVLTNAVEAEWYQQEIPHCPMAINLYASLLAEDAPVQDMVGGVEVVEVMEMTKGATRGPGVVQAVRKMREQGKTVMLDDVDHRHPGIDSSPDGVKISVMSNALHSLQALNSNGAPVEKCAAEEADAQETYVDFYQTFIPKSQPGIKCLVMEGSENCVKSEVKGPPLNYKEQRATIATLHVYQAAARELCAKQPDLKMLHQGGRALYSDEVFDADALQVLLRLNKSQDVARVSDAGTMSWMGQEGMRRAAMRGRLRVCGVEKG